MTSLNNEMAKCRRVEESEWKRNVPGRVQIDGLLGSSTSGGFAPGDAPAEPTEDTKPGAANVDPVSSAAGKPATPAPAQDETYRTSTPATEPFEALSVEDTIKSLNDDLRTLATGIPPLAHFILRAVDRKADPHRGHPEVERLRALICERAEQILCQRSASDRDMA